MRFLYDRKIRNILFQALLVLVILGGGSFVASNTISNLETRGITSGFGFLGDTAGFDISMHLVEYDETSSYGRALYASIINTLIVSIAGILLASVLGVFFGIARLSKNWLLMKVAGIYIESIRNIPLLLQIFFWYFAVFQTLPHPRKSFELGEIFFLNIRGFFMPSVNIKFELIFWMMGIISLLAAIVWYGQTLRKNRNRDEVRSPPWFFGIMMALIIGIVLASAFGSPFIFEIPELKGFNFQGGWTLIPEFSALLLALATYTSAFIAEIVRAGILSVSRGQLEASLALGLTKSQTLKYVIFPQALKVIIPPLTSQYLNLVKNSSLASAIAFPDLVLVFAGTALNQTGQALEVIFITMTFYLIVSLLISLFMNWYNRNYVMVEVR